jgi:circadian clock protein KaiB
MRDATGPLTFRLYVAGQAPNSRRAIGNLEALCRRHLPDCSCIEIVDVFENPKRTLADGVMMTPYLVVAAERPILAIVGDLTEPSVVLDALGIAPGAA